jgi:tripartite-type tricarboxylate transporter receptor subunit TctC
MAEAGIKDFEMSSWQAVYAPKGTPKPIVDKLNGEIVKILKAPDTRQKMQDTMGIEVVASSPEELTKLMQSEIPRWTALIKKSGAQPN